MRLLWLLLVLGSPSLGWEDSKYVDCNSEKILHLSHRACVIDKRSKLYWWAEETRGIIQRTQPNGDDEGAMGMNFMTTIQHQESPQSESEVVTPPSLWNRRIRREHFKQVLQTCCSEAGCSMDALANLCTATLGNQR